MSRRECDYPGCTNITRRSSGRCHVHRYADRGSRPLMPRPESVPPPAAAESEASESGGDKMHKVRGR